MQTCRGSLGWYQTPLDRWRSQSSWMLRSLRWKVIWSSLKIPWSRKKSRRRAIFRNQGWNDFCRTLDTIYVSFCIVLCFLWWCQMFVLFKRLLCYNQKIWFSVQNHKKTELSKSIDSIAFINKGCMHLVLTLKALLLCEKTTSPILVKNMQMRQK